ncbi:lipid-A-disaccharide synthase [Thioflexithrix psekupsensis]|uniref:Lipid-A-disaccharide synthase n=1 Tax=Thioflexithrix psekupsensis TaxID=1570016 RepID=A0A251XCC5_9GAMM|nr:lipid-A-disaccharide synthase [Thioflexithrix psekupsensis]OUD15740.1 lipid-A-disaccharide synthase [Thioflexithrix psekupsensis]
MKIAIVAGELSGDALGAELITALRARCPDVQVSGIGGEAMIAQGFESFYPLRDLSVMGLVEVIRHYPRLRRMLYALRDRWVNDPPDVFIGIDSPDFNLRLARLLKLHGISTAHYVSPSVWAWRRYRLRGIAQACDLMLTLFPFEAHFYRQHGIPVVYVGHPLADQVPLQVDAEMKHAKSALGFTTEQPVVALLPGSRLSEVKQLGRVLLETAEEIKRQCKTAAFVLPAATPELHDLLSQNDSTQFNALSLTLLQGQSRLALAAADVVVVASGTATLEAMLLKKPMVVAYRLHPLTYWLARRLVSVDWVSLPNLLANTGLVPEYLQDQATPQHLSQAVLHWLQHPQRVAEIKQQFLYLHQQLRQNASEQAATAIFNHFKLGKFSAKHP